MTTLGKNIRVMKLLTGELIVTEIGDVTDEGYVVLYPAMIIPIPPQQAGGQQGQIGFGKLMPFSDNTKEITLNPAHIVCDSEPHTQILNAYEQWSKDVRGQDSGIIVPNMRQPNIPADGSKAGSGLKFRGGLNVG